MAIEPRAVLGAAEYYSDHVTSLAQFRQQANDGIRRRRNDCWRLAICGLNGVALSELALPGWR